MTTAGKTGSKTTAKTTERADPLAGRKRAGRDQITLDKDVYTLARERMAHVYDTYDTVIVAFSGGKDSTAVLNVALDTVHTEPRFTRHLPLKAVFFDEEAIPFETEAYVRRVAQRPDVDLTWYCLPIQHRNACSRKHPYWWPWAPESQALWCRPMPPEAVTTLPGFPIWPPEARLTNPDLNGLLAPYEYGNTALLMGIRAQESLIRHRAVTRVGATGLNWIMPYIGATNRGNLWKAYPIYDWTTRDVWTAPAHFGWDYNCNVYEAPIWMADFSFKPIGEVVSGDQIIGWEQSVGARAKQGQARQRLTRATVLASHKRHSKIVKVTMESGKTIYCTPDHQWMHYRCWHHTPNAFAPVKEGHRLSHVIDVPESTDPKDVRKAAWLAGIYDGEGCGDRIYQNPEHNPFVYAAIQDALESLEIPYTKLNGNSNAQKGFRINGGRAGMVRFLNLVDPVRRTSKQIDKDVLTGRFRQPDKIISIEDAGEAEVYALTTTTGNYVCWGYASKNSAYDHLEMAGVSHGLQRCSPAFGEEPLQKIHTYATCFPDVWAKMVDRVPGVGAAGRYALTELYCYRDRPEKPPGMTWPEFLTHYLVKHDLYSTKVAARVRESIARHYRYTADPLVFKAKHPASGCSFDFLLMLAMRGDFKKRKQEAGAMPRSDDFEGNRKIWRKYADELASIVTSGAFGELGHPRPAPADPYALIPPMYR